MKRIITLAVMLFISVQFLAAQDKPAEEKKSSPVQWSEKAHDFGIVELKKPATATFTFKNISDAPVLLTNVRTSCGCTVAKYTKEPVKPGEEGEVSATYNAAKPGRFTKSVTVTIQDAPAPEVLTIKGIVEAPKPSDDATKTEEKK